MSNRLAYAQSPYLLQHAHNPVDWYPWGDEAFVRARTENKPIFLSIGYSTCHWCHVMAHESFESTAIAAILNRDFVPIKVDREERPDVDRVYMAFVQATTGSGGWPMSVWLTPDLEPFYGGTYFPPASRWGRPGFAEILGELARAWHENGDNVRRSAVTVTSRLRGLAGGGKSGAVPGAEALTAGVRLFEHAFDAQRGGFGDAPKFPRPSELLFLLREHARTGEASPRDMVLRTLQAIADGGMRDHLGGGFHRYAVDADWRVPHFEKMLYDQAQLVLAFLEAAQATGDAAYAEVAEDTLAYVVRDMSDPAGGFYSAEDADSVPSENAGTPGARKLEGAFYLWSYDEVGGVLGKDADLVRAHFGIRPGGNAPFDPHDEFGTKNLLHIATPIDELATQFSLSEHDAAVRIDDARQRLLARRATRPRPHLDDKVLTAWNGLMIAACARAARVCGRADFLAAARRSAGFLRERMWDSGARTLYRRYRNGDVAIPGYADDYASVIWGLLELFQADADSTWFEWAVDLQHRQDELFGDEAGGGWFSTTGDDPSVLVRMKEDYDGAEPSPTSVGAHNLLMLAHLTGDAPWATRLDRTLGALGERASTLGRSIPMMLAALSAYHAGVQQLVIVGPQAHEATRQFVRVAAQGYRPFAVTVIVEPGESQQCLARTSPALAGMRVIGDRPTAYLCRDFVCEAPTTDPEVLAAQLRRHRPGRVGADRRVRWRGPRCETSSPS